jgi:hypothetical protein
MERIHTPKPSQQQRILQTFLEKPGEWINGRFFNDTLHITQFHSRIHELQRKGHDIQASTFKDDYGFIYYRLVEGPKVTAICCGSYQFFEVHDRGCPELLPKTSTVSMLF